MLFTCDCETNCFTGTNNNTLLIFNDSLAYLLSTMFGVYINTMKINFLFRFFHITSLQVNKEKLLIQQCLFVSMYMCIHDV